MTEEEKATAEAQLAKAKAQLALASFQATASGQHPTSMVPSVDQPRQQHVGVSAAAPTTALVQTQRFWASPQPGTGQSPAQVAASAEAEDILERARKVGGNHAVSDKADRLRQQQEEVSSSSSTTDKPGGAQPEWAAKAQPSPQLMLQAGF